MPKVESKNAPVQLKDAMIGAGSNLTRNEPGEHAKSRVYLAHATDNRGRVRYYVRWWEPETVEGKPAWRYKSQHLATTESHPSAASLRKWEQRAREAAWRWQESRRRAESTPKFPTDLAEAACEYQNSRNGRLTPKSLLASQYVLDRIGYRAGDWTQAGIDAYLDRRRKEGLSPTTLKMELSQLRGFARWATLRGFLPYDPTVDVRIVVPPRVRPQIPEDEQAAAALWGTTAGEGTPAADLPGNSVLFEDPRRAGVAILALCGLRKSELAYLQARDVDFDSRVLQVGAHYRNTTTKIHRRDLPIGPMLADLLRKVPNAGMVTVREPLLVGSYGDPLTTQPYRWLRPWKIRPHDLRRWCYTALERVGCPPPMRDDLMGHSPKGARGSYAGLRLSDAREYMEQIEQFLARPDAGE